MTIELHDIAGAAGVLLIVTCYLLLQIGRMRSDSLAFSLGNAAGAVLIIVSLLFEFNASAFLIELFWLLISLLGVVRYFMRRNASGKATPLVRNDSGV